MQLDELRQDTYKLICVGPSFSTSNEVHNLKWCSILENWDIQSINTTLLSSGLSVVLLWTQSLWFTFFSTQIVAESVREVFINRLEIGTDITYTTLFPPRVTSAHRMVGDVVVLPAPRAFLVEAGVLQEGDLERQTNEVGV